MVSHIYVNNDNNVETYIAQIDIEKLKQLQKRIDIWHGKGEVQEQRGRYLKDQGNKKVEILSQKQVGWGSGSCDYFGYSSKRTVYIFRYYAYDQHELSKICEYFINHENREYQIEFSRYIKRLLIFKPTDKKERKYFYEVLSSFDFTKYTTDEIIESDINLNDKISLLTKLKQLFTKTTELEESHFLPKSYIDIINEKIRAKEYISSQHRYQTVKYSEKYKNHIKKKNLFALPNIDQFEKHHLI